MWKWLPDFSDLQQFEMIYTVNEHSYGSHGPFSLLFYLSKVVNLHSYVGLWEGLADKREPSDK